MIMAEEGSANSGPCGAHQANGLGEGRKNQPAPMSTTQFFQKNNFFPMTIPVYPVKPEKEAIPPPELVPALGIKPVYVGKNQFDYIIEVESDEAVRAMNPDHTRLKSVPVRGVIVTSRSSSKDFDFISRFLAPGSG